MENLISNTHPSRHDDEYEDEVDLMKYVFALWRHRLAVTVMTLACGLAAFFVSWRTQPTYEATAQLVVSQSKVGELTSPAVSTASYKALLDNQSLALQILREFALDKPPYNIRVSSFRAGIVSSEVLRDTNVIVVKVRLPDAALAARVANRYVELSIGLAQRLSQEETVTARDIIKTQLDQSRQRLDQAEARLQAYKREAQVDLLKKDVDTLLGQRGDLLKLIVELEGEKARLAMAQEQLSQKDRIDTVKRSIDTDPALMEAARQNTKQDGQILPLQLRNEFVNPVYESLDQVVATSKTRLSGLENQKIELVKVLKLDAPQIAQLSQLYAKEIELARLETEYDLAKKIYIDVASRYEQARVQVASRTAQLQLLDSALPPDRPLSRGVLMNTEIALAAGFMLSMLGMLFFDFIATSNRLQTEKGRQASEPARSGVQ